MPTYRYKCKSCSRIIEKIQKFTDTPLTICPSCKGELVKVVTASGGFILKGEGFYSVDSRKKPVSCPAKPDSETQPCSECPHR